MSAISALIAGCRLKRGLVPSYQGFNSRRLVKLSEVLAAIEATRTGGAR